MAKKQKTFYLNEELEKVVEALSETTGASFTKITTAALIQYVIGSHKRQSTTWMRLAVGLERGDLSLPHVLLAVFREQDKQTQEVIDLAKRHESIDGFVTTWKMTASRGQHTYDVWEKAIADADDPLSVVINMVSRDSRTTED